MLATNLSMKVILHLTVFSTGWRIFISSKNYLPLELSTERHIYIIFYIYISWEKILTTESCLGGKNTLKMICTISNIKYFFVSMVPISFLLNLEFLDTILKLWCWILQKGLQLVKVNTLIFKLALLSFYFCFFHFVVIAMIWFYIE